MADKINTYIGDINSMSGSKFNVISTTKSINEFPMSCMPTAFIVTTGYNNNDTEVDLAISDAYGNANKIMTYERTAISHIVNDLYNVNDIKGINDNTPIMLSKQVHFKNANSYEDIAACIRDTNGGSLLKYFAYLAYAINNKTFNDADFDENAEADFLKEAYGKHPK